MFLLYALLFVTIVFRTYSSNLYFKSLRFMPTTYIYIYTSLLRYSLRMQPFCFVCMIHTFPLLFRKDSEKYSTFLKYSAPNLHVFIKKPYLCKIMYISCKESYTSTAINKVRNNCQSFPKLIHNVVGKCLFSRTYIFLKRRNLPLF